ncbi:MAG: Gfo/Idh/MocA family oxidoreductase [Pirellulales bacterium]
MIRVGVVGLGRFGRLHALTLARLGEAQLAALVARRAESLANVQAELPGVPGWTSLDEAIAESDAQAWVVACSTSQHADVARKLLAAGKTVLLEKPISESLAEAESLRPLVRDDSSNLMLGHIVLFNSEFRALRAEAARRGTPSYIDCVRHRPATIVHDFPGENPLHAAMVHDLYLVQALMGGAEPEGFTAQYHRTPDGAIDLAVAQLRWPAPRGTVASIAASYLAPAGMPPRGFDRLELFGEGWAARMEPNPRPLTVYDDRARWPLALEILADSSGVAGMMAEELRCFCRVAAGIEPVAAGASYFDGLQVQRWMERLARSADEHHR